jgi:ABC-type cobalamin transport system permease subunit
LRCFLFVVLVMLLLVHLVNAHLAHRLISPCDTWSRRSSWTLWRCSLPSLCPTL